MGGHGEGHAKHLGTKVDEHRFNLWANQFAQLNPEPKKFDRGIFTYFIRRRCVSIGTYISQQTIRMAAAIRVITLVWVGCQYLVESHVDPTSFVIFRGGVSSEPMTRPMNAFVNNNSKGPFAVPQPTIGSINYGSTKSEDEIWFHLVTLEGLLKIGATIDTIDQFLNAGNGGAFLL